MLKPEHTKLTREDYEHLTYRQLAQLGYKHNVKTIQRRIEVKGMHPWDAVHTPKLRTGVKEDTVRPTTRALNIADTSAHRLAAMPWRSVSHSA